MVRFTHNKKVIIMKNANFKFYSAHTFYNSVGVAVYENKDGDYILQVEKDFRKVRGTETVKMTKEQYENLPYNDYNSLVRLQAAMAQCNYFIK